MEAQTKDPKVKASQTMGATKKRHLDAISNQAEVLIEDISMQDCLMALYRDNFCACKDGECKIGL